MFISQQYNFKWNDVYSDTFMEYDAPDGIRGNAVSASFAWVWDCL